MDNFVIMSRKRKNLLIEKIKILDIGDKGRSVAKHKERVIFIQGGVPGDICDIIVYKRRRKYWEARIEKIHHLSNNRETPKCEHFGICGGCKWQNMNYNSQIEYKENSVINNLRRIGKLEIPHHNKIISSKEKYFYRNKLEFTFSNNRWLSLQEIESNDVISNKNGCGFHIPNMYDKIIDLENCYLQEEPSNTIRLSIVKFANENKLSFFDIKKHNGLLRNLLIRTSTTGDLMVLVQFYEKDKKNIELLMNYLNDSFPTITSLLYTVNQKANDTIYDQEIICHSGQEYIKEKIEKLTFRIGAKSFFQTNINQAKILYKKVKEFANIGKNNIVYDLYTGTGTIAQYIASKAKKVIGIDSVEEGITSAIENSKENKIDNCSFFKGDMKEIFTNEFINSNGLPDIIITNPPREGMHIKVVEEILRIEAKRIIYVSCNPSTQARDLNILKDKYEIDNIQPVDMFPQTHHVENIVSLKIKLQK